MRPYQRIFPLEVVADVEEEKVNVETGSGEENVDQSVPVIPKMTRLGRIVKLPARLKD